MKWKFAFCKVQHLRGDMICNGVFVSLRMKEVYNPKGGRREIFLSSSVLKRAQGPSSLLSNWFRGPFPRGKFIRYVKLPSPHICIRCQGQEWWIYSYTSRNVFMACHFTNLAEEWCHLYLFFSMAPQPLWAFAAYFSFLIYTRAVGLSNEWSARPKAST
jgi:hypothetical protein